MSKHDLKNVYKHQVDNVWFVELLLDESTAMLMRHGETRADAEKMSRDFADTVCRQLAGQLLYFGKNTRLNADMKKTNIRADHGAGLSINQIAEKYSLSARHVYDILFYDKEKTNTPPSGKGAPLIAITAAKIFIKAGIAQYDAVEAGRGLLAVIAARFGGKSLYLPKARRTTHIIRDIIIYRQHRGGRSIACLSEHYGLSVEDLEAIITNFPRRPLPGRKNLLLIKRQLTDISTSFRDYANNNRAVDLEGLDEVTNSLDVAAEWIGAAEKKLILIEQNDQKGD